MTPTFLKKIVLCSVTFTGGFITLSYKKSVFPFCKEGKENSDGSSSYIYLPEISENYVKQSVDTSFKFDKISLPVYWKLCRSKDSKIRHKAVQFLSKATLEKWQYAVISQASAMNTSVGFARSLNAHASLFLPPPFKDLDEDSLQKELYLLLNLLPISELDDCQKHLIKKVEKSAKDLLKIDYNADLDIGDPSVLYHSQQKKNLVFSYNKICLRTILSCSKKSCLREIMMKKGVLKTLLKVSKLHYKDIEMLSIIGQIIANFATEEKFRKAIHLTGWTGILAQWVKSPAIAVYLPAAKSLANLDLDDISHPVYEDGIYILNPLSRLSQNNINLDVIFIHGILGATFWTWRQCDSQNIEKLTTSTSTSKKYSMCWPKDWLASDLPSLRILSIDYKTCLTSWSPCCYHGKKGIEKRASDIIPKLLSCNVGERPIIWITHSMGGLIVKKILMEAHSSKNGKIHSLARNTVGIIFYSVPHIGSEIASIINSASFILMASSDITELRKESPSLISLHEDFKNFVSKEEIPVLSFGESVKSRLGIDLSILVPADSANPGFGEFNTLPVDHLSVCKPKSAKSSDYLKVVDFIQDIISKLPSSQSSQMKNPEVFEICKLLSLIP